MSKWRRAVRLISAVLDGVARATALTLSLFVITAVAVVAVVVTTKIRVAFPGLIDIWAEPYADSPSVVFQPNGAGVVILFVATVAGLARGQVRPAMRR